MKRIIVFPEEIFEETRKFMLRDPNNEQFGYLLAGLNKTDEFIKLLVHTFVPANGKDLQFRSVGGVCPSPEFQLQVYSRCKAENHHLIDVHSHPFDNSNHVRFSGIDDRYELGGQGQEGTFGFTSWWIPGIYHASIVFGQASLDARLYDATTKQAHPIDEVQVIVTNTKKLIPTSATKSRAHDNKTTKGDQAQKKNGSNSCESDDMPARYSRQILAFGELGQKELQNTSVAVVGAGGISSIVVETLARLGIRKILCVDDDSIDESNLSRILGSFPNDSKKNRKKVDVLYDHVKHINNEIEFIPIDGSVLDPDVLLRLKAVDYLIAGTDTHSSRMVLNNLSVQYFIPYIDLGFGLQVDESKKAITSATGKVRIVIPGKWCLRCIDEIDQSEVGLETMSSFERRRQIERGYISGVDIPNPSVIFLNMTIASLGICEFLNLLVPFKEAVNYLYYDMLNTNLHKITAERRDDCIICGQNMRFGKGDLLTFEDIRPVDRDMELPEAKSNE